MGCKDSVNLFAQIYLAILLQNLEVWSHSFQLFVVAWHYGHYFQLGSLQFLIFSEHVQLAENAAQLLRRFCLTDVWLHQIPDPFLRVADPPRTLRRDNREYLSLFVILCLALFFLFRLLYLDIVAFRFLPRLQVALIFLTLYELVPEFLISQLQG